MDRNEVLKLLETYSLDELIEIGGFTDLPELLAYLYDNGVLEPPTVVPL